MNNLMTSLDRPPRGIDAKDKAASRSGGVDLCPLACQHPEADAAFRQVLHDANEVMQVPPEAVELPHHQRIALAQRLEAGVEARAAVLLARGAVLVDRVLGHAGPGQGMILEIKVLASPSCFDKKVAA